jgi:hypothetical protein
VPAHCHVNERNAVLAEVEQSLSLDCPARLRRTDPRLADDNYQSAMLVISHLSSRGTVSTIFCTMVGDFRIKHG